MTCKQTSAKVSKLAAKYLAMSDFALWDILDRGTRPQKDALFKAIRTLAASCLSQDEVKGGGKAKAKPAGWLHTLHMEGGQTSARVTQQAGHPFGKPGVDYDRSYSVTSEPLVKP